MLGLWNKHPFKVLVFATQLNEILWNFKHGKSMYQTKSEGGENNKMFYGPFKEF